MPALLLGPVVLVVGPRAIALDGKGNLYICELPRPAGDVVAIEILPHVENPGDVLELLLGLACLAGPFELRDDRVLGRRQRDQEARNELAPLASSELGLTEGTLLADDQVHLERGLRVDHVELTPVAQRIPSAVRVCVEAGLGQRGHETLERLACRLDHEVRVVGGAGTPVMTARERARHHVGDFERFEDLDDPAQ